MRYALRLPGHLAVGAAPTAAWQAFRKVGGGGSAGDMAALDLIQTTPASAFYPGGPAMPSGD